MSEDKIINLTERRNAMARPDAEFVRKDEYGRPLYCFLLSYEMDGSHYSTEVWAYDEAEARKRVQAMRQTLTYDGQLFECVPA